MRHFLAVIFFGGFFVFGVTLSTGLVYAEQNPIGLTVTPAFQEITLDQNDDQKNLPVSLTNTTSGMVTLRVAAYDFGSLDESGGVAFLGASNDLEKKYTLASWMHLEKDTVIIAPGETVTVRVTIENRSTLSPGGHYGALTFKTENSSQGAITGDAVSVNQLFSTLIFAKKIGGEIYDLELKAAEYRNNFVKFQDRIDLRFTNSGNVHVVPRGTVVVSDSLGRIIAKGIINEESSLILPESIRIYPVMLKSLAWCFFPGKYTIAIAYRYDGKGDFTTTSISFDFIPLPAILAFLIFIVTGGWYVAKRHSRTGEKKALSRPFWKKRTGM